MTPHRKRISRSTTDATVSTLSLPLPTAPARTRTTDGPEAVYLRRWITHQADLYNDLLRTIASAPTPVAVPVRAASRN